MLGAAGATHVSESSTLGGTIESLAWYCRWNDSSEFHRHYRPFSVEVFDQPISPKYLQGMSKKEAFVLEVTVLSSLRLRFLKLLDTCRSFWEKQKHLCGTSRSHAKGGSASGLITEQWNNLPQFLYSVCQTLSSEKKRRIHQIYQHWNQKSFVNSTFACIMRYKSNLSCNHERKINRNQQKEGGGEHKWSAKILPCPIKSVPGLFSHATHHQEKSQLWCKPSKSVNQLSVTVVIVVVCLLVVQLLNTLRRQWRGGHCRTLA